MLMVLCTHCSSSLLGSGDVEMREDIRQESGAGVEVRHSIFGKPHDTTNLGVGSPM
jgi:hypothetical protein